MRTHDIQIPHGDLVLRPMTEDDWPLVEACNADPEVLYFAESDEVERRLPDDVRAIYRHISRTALMFIIEVGGRGVGEPLSRYILRAPRAAPTTLDAA